MGQWLTIFVASIGFGAAGEAMRRYRGWKNRRRALPAPARNAGFWTDSRINHTEAVLTALFLAGPWTVIVMFINTNENLYASMAGMLSYPLAIYLILKGLNRPEPQ